MYNIKQASARNSLGKRIYYNTCYTNEFNVRWTYIAVTVNAEILVHSSNYVSTFDQPPISEFESHHNYLFTFSLQL